MDIVTILSGVCLGLAVWAGVLLELRRRYLRTRQEQHFCQLTRDAML